MICFIGNEVKSILKHLSDKNPCNSWFRNCCFNQLKEYETLDKEGRLVVLPCKIGATVWVVTHPFNVYDDFEFYEDAKEEIYESYISSITFYEHSNQYRIYANETKQFIKAYFMECDFGKTVFLTREEAEKALKEMEKDDAAN